MGGLPFTCELFKTVFLERFFPREMMEAKVEEFINLKHGSMTVREYSLKFLKLSRYATSLVSNTRHKMSKLLTGIAEDLEEECRAAMLNASMGLSRLMVHVQNVEENRNRKHTRAWNRSREVEKNFQGRVVLKSEISPVLRRNIPPRGVKFIQGSQLLGFQSLS